MVVVELEENLTLAARRRRRDDGEAEVGSLGWFQKKVVKICILVSSQAAHAASKVVHERVHLAPEPLHAAALALDMLHEPAERAELHAAPVEEVRALVDALRVRGAPQVRVERAERAERAVAQHALVRARRPPGSRSGLTTGASRPTGTPRSPSGR